MPLKRKRQFLICYDIKDPKRLGRIHRFLSKNALSVQYSVFIVKTQMPKLDALLAELEKLIKPTEDDVRVYTLSDQHDPVVLGRAIIPDGLVFIDSQTDLFQDIAVQLIA